MSVVQMVPTLCSTILLCCTSPQSSITARELEKDTIQVGRMQTKFGDQCSGKDNLEALIKFA
jgi:hypothetical protein